MKRTYQVLAFALAVWTALSAGPSVAASTAHELIKGSGSSWAANAVNQWVGDVASKYQWQIVYTANGAARGRSDYAKLQNHFAVTDGPFQGKDPSTGAEDSPLGRSFAYLPIVAGGTSFPYNVVSGGNQIKTIRLSGETIAKIFTNQIGNWNDDAITKDNNGNKLPPIPIIPVVRSDGAGVTNQFTIWLSKEYPSLWKKCNGGKSTPTSYFPVDSCKGPSKFQAQSGSDGVMNFVKSKNAVGAIAMEEYSYPLNSGFPVAKMLNKAGYFTLPTQYNVAVALTAAKINKNKNDPNYLTQSLDDVYVNSDKRAYPLSSYVYAIIPTKSSDKVLKTTGQRQTLADFLTYSVCEGQAEIGPTGYSPLPKNLVEASFEQIAKIKAADSKVVVQDKPIANCHNPTFDSSHPNENHLAKIAPNPPDCDQVGHAPCGDGAGSYNKNPDEDGKLAADANSTNQGSGTSSDSSSTATTDAPASSAAAGAASGTSATTVNAQGVASEISADRFAGPSPVLTALVVGLFVGVLVVPVAVSRLVPLIRGDE